MLTSRLGARIAVAALALLAAGCGHGPEGSPPPVRPGEPAPGPAFVDIASRAGIRYAASAPDRRPRDLLASNGSGCGWLDYDGDGDLDLLLVGSPHCALFRNDLEPSSPPHFVDVTAAAGLDIPGNWFGVGVGDWDNDSDPDLCLAGYRCGALLRNDRGVFRREAASAALTFPTWGQSPAFADVDNDGRLDLYVAAYVRWDPGSPRYCPRAGMPTLCGPEMYAPERGRLYLNRGGGRFTDVTAAAGMDSCHGKSWGAAFQDVDDDGRQDLYVANDMVPGDLFLNLGARRAPPGGPRFRNAGIASGTALDVNGHVQGEMAADWADYDNDGRPDLVVTNFTAQPTALYHNDGKALFTEVSTAAGVAQPTFPHIGFGGKFLDFDNDGWRDLLLVHGHVEENADRLGRGEHYRQPVILLRNVQGRFADVSRGSLAGLPEIVGRGAAFGDFDNDGRVDAAVMDLEGNPLLLHNRAPGGGWCGLRLVGTRSNRDGIGARVVLSAGGRSQRLEVQTSGSVLSANDPRLCFGVGGARSVDEAVITWPSGRRTRLKTLAVNRYSVVTEL